MPPPTKRAKRWAQAGALPLLLAVSGVLLVCGGFAAPLVWPWLVLIAAGLSAIARWGIAPQTPARHSVEGALLAALATLALTQATGGLWSPLYPLVYLLAAGYMLALPLRLSVPMVAALIALDGALFAPVLKTQWPLFLAHASFAALFAALYHALLGARLALARRAESTAVQRRVADAEECARELRLVATADAETDPGGRQLPGGGAEGGEVLPGGRVADGRGAFSESDQRVLEALSAEVTRAIEAERLLGAVRREKEEKARFFRALEDLNRTTTVLQAAESAVAQARRMCPALDLCAVTLAEDRRHRIVAVEGGASGALRDLSFGDNAGLVSSVVKLGAPLPGRALGAMDRVVIFDNGTVVRGLQALKIFPLRAGETTVGTLVCGARKPDALPESAQRELSMLARSEEHTSELQSPD